MGHPLLKTLAGAAAAALLASGCLDWGSLYGQPATDDDAGITHPDAAVTSTVGCSDGTAELTAGAQVAACAGAWSVPGVVVERAPSCNRRAGNDSTSSGGDQCNVSDLCAEGWHVCSGSDLPANGAFTCDQLVRPGDVPPPGPDPNATYLYITRQTTGPNGDNQMCNGDPTGASDDVLGCGTVGSASSCPPFNRLLSLPDSCPPPFACGDDPNAEAQNVISLVPDANGGQLGGVLCCKG